MTDEETRELDAQVAEKVMGWRKEQTYMAGEHGSIYRWYAPSGQEHIGPLPAYSTDGNAMVAVIERMRELGWKASIDIEDDGECYCQFLIPGGPHGPLRHRGSLQEAVARAALAAVEAQS